MVILEGAARAAPCNAFFTVQSVIEALKNAILINALSGAVDGAVAFVVYALTVLVGCADEVNVLDIAAICIDGNTAVEDRAPISGTLADQRHGVKSADGRDVKLAGYFARGEMENIVVDKKGIFRGDRCADCLADYLVDGIGIAACRYLPWNIFLQTVEVTAVAADLSSIRNNDLCFKYPAASG